MTALKARLSTSVTPNWRVKPTAAIASTDAVTRPNPSEARKSVTEATSSGPAPGRDVPARPGVPLGLPAPGRAGDCRAVRSSGQGSQLRGRDGADRLDLPARGVGVDLEDAGGVVEAVEVGRAARPHVLDRLARLDQRRALGERVADRRARRAITDLDDVRPVHARVGALRHDHRE